MWQSSMLKTMQYRKAMSMVKQKSRCVRSYGLERNSTIGFSLETIGPVRVAPYAKFRRFRPSEVLPLAFQCAMPSKSR